MTETRTPTLTDFLLSRLDDYEKAIEDVTSTYFDAPMSEAEMWADLAAKRRIVEDCLAADTMLGDDTLRALASVYADHPDYRDEWAV